jgi:hypothetical protein
MGIDLSGGGKISRRCSAYGEQLIPITWAQTFGRQTFGRAPNCGSSAFAEGCLHDQKGNRRRSRRRHLRAITSTCRAAQHRVFAPQGPDRVQPSLQMMIDHLVAGPGRRIRPPGTAAHGSAPAGSCRRVLRSCRALRPRIDAGARGSNASRNRVQRDAQCP